MRPRLNQLDADIVCLQEVNGQETPEESGHLLALHKLLDSTPYAGYRGISTMLVDG